MPHEHAVEATSVRWGSATERGPRRFNADAVAAHRDPATGWLTVAVADGIGDDPRAAHAAALCAHAAVTATAGDSVAAIVAAQQSLLAAAPGDHDGDSVLAVATPHRDSSGPAGGSQWDGGWDIAWVGDCRVYYWNGRVLARITADHTVAEYYRARHLPVTPRMEHLVTTSVRTVRPSFIGHAHTPPGAGRLLLCSDGVHKTLDVGFIRAVLDQPTAPDSLTTTLVSAAHQLGGRDNATALVVDTMAPRPTAAIAA